MSYGSPTHRRSAARFWVGLALLFMLGAQALEASHHHPANESLSTCVLLHSGTGVALPTTIPTTPVLAAIGILLILLRAQTVVQPLLAAYSPRGPPRNS
tara:strand:- start:963 stop:1259 length:297 start_codon:yes stop_codon:yes gene_type:complete